RRLLVPEHESQRDDDCQDNRDAHRQAHDQDDGGPAVIRPPYPVTVVTVPVGGAGPWHGWDPLEKARSMGSIPLGRSKGKHDVPPKKAQGEPAPCYACT